MRVRRTEYLFLYREDGAFLDVPALLRGRAEVAPLRRTLGISILAGEEYPLAPQELELLAEVPSDRWVDADSLDDACVAALAEKGLLVSDATDGRLAELRARDERLAGSGWNIYAALYHFMTRWRDVDLSTPSAGEERGPEEADEELVREWVERFGPPPPHFHSRPGALRVLELPVARRDGPLYDALLRRRTTRSFDGDRPMTVEQLAAVLRYAFGWHGYAPSGENVTLLRRTSPSGGALHPTEVYPLLVRVEGAEPGLYHYDGARHALALLEPLSAEEAADLADELTCGQGYPREAHALFLLTARFFRSFWKYRRHRRAYAVLLLDAGHLSQTFYLVCTELGLGAFVTAAINGANIEERLGLDGFEEGAIAVCGCGTTTELDHPPDTDFLPYVPRETAL